MYLKGFIDRNIARIFLACGKNTQQCIPSKEKNVHENGHLCHLG